MCKSATYSSQLGSWTIYVEKPGMTAISELQNLLKVIVDGWPDRQRDLHPQLRPLWPYRDELVEDDGIVLKGNRIIMPASLHTETW